MSKIGLFYGSTNGNTNEAAEKLAEAIGKDSVELINIDEAETADFAKFNAVILGTSTWGTGDLQEDWDFFLPKFDEIDFAGKKAAIFGLGDQEGFPDTFADGMKILYDKSVGKGAEHVGPWPKEGYNFTASAAMMDGQFLGLVLDVDNQPEMTDERIAKWAAQIKESLLIG